MLLEYRSMQSTICNQRLSTPGFVSGSIYLKVTAQRFGQHTCWDVSPIIYEMRFCWLQAMRQLNSAFSNSFLARSTSVPAGTKSFA